MESKPRVVVTGIGVISPVGLDVGVMWQNLIAGRSGIGPITQFDPQGLNVRIAGEAHGFDPTQFMSASEARRIDRFTQFAMAAHEEAMHQSRLVVNAHNAYEVGAIIGSAAGGVWTYMQGVEDLRVKGPHRLNPFYMTAVNVDAPSVHVALRTGARGPNQGVNAACASGADAIGLAYETIRRGHARVMFTGGFDSAITPLGLGIFDGVHALSRRNDDPAGACRPFDADRDGFVVAEGGALLVLEELEFALRREAQPLAEVVSYATTSDAVHLTAPDPDGAGAAECMKLALQRAGAMPEEVSYINAHGTGTMAGDAVETCAIKKALGDYAYRVPISSTKSMTGHLMGAAGALEAVICVQALITGCLPPTINLHTPDPACNLDYIPLRSRQAAVELVLSNSFGFGGHNTTLALRAYR